MLALLGSQGNALVGLAGPGRNTMIPTLVLFTLLILMSAGAAELYERLIFWHRVIYLTLFGTLTIVGIVLSAAPDFLFPTYHGIIAILFQAVWPGAALAGLAWSTLFFLSFGGHSVYRHQRAGLFLFQYLAFTPVFLLLGMGGLQFFNGWLDDAPVQERPAFLRETVRYHRSCTLVIQFLDAPDPEWTEIGVPCHDQKRVLSYGKSRPPPSPHETRSTPFTTSHHDHLLISHHPGYFGYPWFDAIRPISIAQLREQGFLPPERKNP
jgi:hypothetical protein